MTAPEALIEEAYMDVIPETETPQIPEQNN
jgi:hypothetical protein